MKKILIICIMIYLFCGSFAFADTEDDKFEGIDFKPYMKELTSARITLTVASFWA